MYSVEVRRLGPCGRGRGTVLRFPAGWSREIPGFAPGDLVKLTRRGREIVVEPFGEADDRGLASEG